MNYRTKYALAFGALGVTFILSMIVAGARALGL
jgi:hypothetical protein